MKRLFMLYLLIYLLIVGGVAYSSQLTLFSDEIQAQSHCPSDQIVWLNLPTGIWHVKGARWYGRTKHGGFVCKLEALAEGGRASFNG